MWYPGQQEKQLKGGGVKIVQTYTIKKSIISTILMNNEFNEHWM